MAGLQFRMLKETQILERHSRIVLMGNCLLRSKHFNEGFKFQPNCQPSLKSGFHQSQLPDYPATKRLPLPLNIKELVSSEKLKFSPQRNRDISGSFISSSSSPPACKVSESAEESPVDDRIECYDCSGTINLSSVMQSNVPFPFVSKGKPIHLNMPGGQWGQKEKYVSEDLNRTHQANSRQFQFSSGGTVALARKTGIKHSYMLFPLVDPMFSNSLSSIFSTSTSQIRKYSTKKNKVEINEQLTDTVSTTNVPQLSRREKLKAAVKDYGVVVIVFHVGISLVSLGCCYAIIASGVDLSSVFKDFGVDEGAATAGNAARFVIAYAVHKSLAPGRIALTLTAVPFVVKKLRKMGILKAPQVKAQ